MGKAGRLLLEYSFAVLALGAIFCVPAFAQVDRREVRSGNRLFKKGSWDRSGIEYRKALVKDSSSFAATYNLGSSLYRQENFEEATREMERLKEAAPQSAYSADYYYNLGNLAAMRKDWQGAVDAYKRSLLERPDDMDAKENYAYAKLMLQKDGGGGGGGGGDGQDDQSQDDNQDQNQDNQGDQNQDQNRNQNDQGDRGQDQNQDQDQEQGEAKISPQQAQQMLRAIQAREKETQDKVNKEKAAALKSRQKDKNW